jgi:hypothetical protein
MHLEVISIEFTSSLLQIIEAILEALYLSNNWMHVEVISMDSAGHFCRQMKLS